MAKACRGRSSRTASYGVLDGPAHLFWKVFHGFLCLAALILGFRLSGEAVVFLGSWSKGALSNRRSSSGLQLEGTDVALRFPYITEASRQSTVNFHSSTDLPIRSVDAFRITDKQANQQPPPSPSKSTRVNVGRHEILIRSRRHPDPLQSLKAHKLLKIVQYQQVLRYGGKSGRKQFLVITTTSARTFQALHLTSLIHTLQLVPFPLTWIVVEAGGVSEETAALLSTSKIAFHHIGLVDAMPEAVDQQHQMERRLRMEGLRLIREKQLDGIVLFMDDSNTYSFEFFKEAQKTKWIGGFSVGLLSDLNVLEDRGKTLVAKSQKGFSSMVPSLEIQGPVCGLQGQIVGWRGFSKVIISSVTQDERSLEWAGFSLNAKLLWAGFKVPAGFRNWNEVLKQSKNVIQSPLDFLQNFTLVEPLGDCGRSILLWRLQVEARADSRFPSRWRIEPPLEVVVPSRRTPWPDLPQKHSVVHSESSLRTEKRGIKPKNKIRRKMKVPV